MSDPKFEVDEPVNVIGDEQVFPGTVLGIQFNVPVWWYIIGLDDPIESDYGPQKGLFVPESCLEECQEEDSEPVIIESEWSTVGSYVYVCNQEQVDQGHPTAIDVEVRLVHDDEGRIYIQTVDEIDGTSLWDDIPYFTQSDALIMAKEVISESHEAEPTENAAAYLARVMAEEQAESH
jgi:hypothetical protein